MFDLISSIMSFDFRSQTMWSFLILICSIPILYPKLSQLPLWKTTPNISVWFGKDIAIEKEFDEAEDEWEFAESDSGLKQYEVPNELKNKRINAILSLEPDMSRSQECGSLITNGMVALQMGNEKKSVVTRKSKKLSQGTIIHMQHNTFKIVYVYG